MFTLVTGSSKGLGFFLAKGLKENNKKIILNSRKKSSLRKAASKLESLSFAADLTSYDQAKSLMKEIKKQGQLSSIICNIGNSKSKSLSANSDKEWIKSLNDNLMTTINTVNAVREVNCYEDLKIVCISSICSLQYIEGAPIEYSVSKSALNTYVKFMSKILIKENIRINSIIPGNLIFEGSTWEKKDKKIIDETLNNVPLKRFGTPEDILSLVKFLISKKSDFMIGSSIILDGGQTIIS